MSRAPLASPAETEDEHAMHDHGHEPLTTAHFQQQMMKFLQMDHQWLNRENEIERLVHMHQTEYWSDLEERDIHGGSLEQPGMKTHSNSMFHPKRIEDT
ncbi:hypothetical protein ACFX13_005015 [Malus domestica]